jgi:hypothetical protein
MVGTCTHCQSFDAVLWNEPVSPDADPGSSFWIPALAPEGAPGQAGMTSTDSIAGNFLDLISFCQIVPILVLVPRLCWESVPTRTLHSKPTYLDTHRETEPPGSAFPGRAWEREERKTEIKALLRLWHVRANACMTRKVQRSL